MPIFANSAFAVSAFRELAYKGQIPGVKRLAGKHEQRRLTACITDAIAGYADSYQNANSAKHDTVDVLLPT